MIVMLASRFDQQAAALAEKWKHRGACLLTCEGLSRRGWRHESAVPALSLAVLGGAPVPALEVSGVFTRLTAVTEAELPHIVEEERAYVASEMHAFLLAWLVSLRCPLLNAPTPLNLSGPGWHAEQWIWAAARAGLAVQPSRRVAPTFAAEAPFAADLRTALPEGSTLATFRVVGAHCLGADGHAIDDALSRGLQRLRESAGVELLTASFARVAGESRFIGATASIDLTRAELADALLRTWEARA